MRRCFRRSAGRYTRWAPRWPDGRFPQGVSCPLGKASILLRKSPTVQICWSFFISSPLLSPRQKLPPGEKFQSCFEFHQQSDPLEIFHIIAVAFPKAETAAWGKFQSCFEFHQQSDPLEIFHIIAVAFPKAETVLWGKSSSVQKSRSSGRNLKNISAMHW